MTAASNNSVAPAQALVTKSRPTNPLSEVIERASHDIRTDNVFVQNPKQVKPVLELRIHQLRSTITHLQTAIRNNSQSLQKEVQSLSRMRALQDHGRRLANRTDRIITEYNMVVSTHQQALRTGDWTAAHFYLLGCHLQAREDQFVRSRESSRTVPGRTVPGSSKANAIVIE